MKLFLITLLSSFFTVKVFQFSTDMIISSANRNKLYFILSNWDALFFLFIQLLCSYYILDGSESGHPVLFLILKEKFSDLCLCVFYYSDFHSIVTVFLLSLLLLFPYHMRKVLILSNVFSVSIKTITQLFSFILLVIAYH